MKIIRFITASALFLTALVGAVSAQTAEITNTSQWPSQWFAARRHALAVKYNENKRTTVNMSGTAIAPRVMGKADVALILVATASVGAQSQEREATIAGRDVTIQVTVHPHNDRARAAAEQFQADDFTVREETRPQRIISVKRPGEAPPILAVLIQDDLVSRVNNEIKGVKEFIRRLPEGSRVLTGYITSGSFRIAQDFTTDLALAADSLRILRSDESSAPFNPYVEVVEALRRFDTQPAGRRMALLVSDGLDVSHGFRSASPLQSIVF